MPLKLCIIIKKEKALQLAAGHCKTYKTMEGTTYTSVISNYGWKVQFFLLKMTASVTIIFP